MSTICHMVAQKKYGRYDRNLKDSAVIDLDKKTILCTGNPEVGLASEIFKRFPQTEFISESISGHDLTLNHVKKTIAKKALEYDFFINSSALWQYHQALLLDVVYKTAQSARKSLHIVSIGSTTDRATKGSDWTYQQEKKALRSASNAMGLKSIWQGGPKVSYVTFGTLENKADKHPGRKIMTFKEAVDCIEYAMILPEHLVLNELSVDPIQVENNE